jgi:predicted RNA-binding Zn-ribbon protein involved in translation (DUF1610 family)
VGFARLTDDEMNIFRMHLESKLQTAPPCPMCGKGVSWTRLTHGGILLSELTQAGAIRGTLVVMMRCDRCGFIASFSAESVGLWTE